MHPLAMKVGGSKPALCRLRLCCSNNVSRSSPRLVDRGTVAVENDLTDDATSRPPPIPKRDDDAIPRPANDAND